jgi:hypothetical protein
MRSVVVGHEYLCRCSCSKYKQVVLTHVWTMEKHMRTLDENSKKLGKRVDEIMVLTDLDGVGIGHR